MCHSYDVFIADTASCRSPSCPVDGPKFSNENIYRMLIFAVERLHCVCVAHHYLDQVHSCVGGLLPFGVQLDYRVGNCRYEVRLIGFLFFTGEIEFIIFILDRTV